MIILAEDLGGNVAVVAVMNTIRMAFIVLLVPIALKVLNAAGAVVNTVPPPVPEAMAPLEYYGKFAILFAVSIPASMIFKKLKVPAAEIIASLVITAILNPLCMGLTTYPALWQLASIWIIGSAMGSQLSRQAIKTIRKYLLPSLILMFVLFTLGFTLGAALHYVTGLDLTTALMSSCPGGMTAMILLAVDIHANVALVAAMHAIRQVAVMLTMPVIIRKILTRKKLAKKEKLP
jgi:membrane AbrB-like protein